MSFTHEQIISDGIEILRADFHAAMINTLMLGMYTTIYAGAMYIYMTGKTSRTLIIPIGITLLYFPNIMAGYLEWGNINTIIGTKGKSMKKDVLADLNPTSNYIVGMDISQITPLVVSDGLLIWRCFKVWNSSFRIIAPSLFFYLSEIALYLIVVIFDILPNPYLSNTFYTQLFSAGMFMTVATTLWTSTLIAYRINSFSKHDTSNRAQPRRFYNILQVVLQSSLIYSLVLVAYALLLVIPQTEVNNVSLYCARGYGSVIAFTITSIAPTLMVAQISLASNSSSDTEPTIIGISGGKSMI